MYENGAWYNAAASDDLRVMTAFASGQAADFDLDKIDWGGPATPAEDASFEQLTAAQRAVVVAHLGYAQVERQVFYNATADAGEQIRTGFVQGSSGDYENQDVAWGDAAKPSDSTAFADLTYDQQNQVLAHLDYQRWDGAVYFDAEAAADQQYRLTLEQGENKDYENIDIVWSAIATPLLSHKIDVVSVPVAGQTYSILIDGASISYTARAAEGATPADTTTAQLVAGLVAAINGSGQFGAIRGGQPDSDQRWRSGRQSGSHHQHRHGRHAGTARPAVRRIDCDPAIPRAGSDRLREIQPGYLRRYRQQQSARTRVLTAFTEGVDYTNAAMDWGSTRHSKARAGSRRRR